MSQIESVYHSRDIVVVNKKVGCLCQDILDPRFAVGSQRVRSLVSFPADRQALEVVLGFSVSKGMPTIGKSKVDCFCPFRVTEDKKLQTLRYGGMLATTAGVVIITGRPVWIEVISARERHHRIRPSLKFCRLDRCARSLRHQHRQKTNLGFSWSPITVFIKTFRSGATSSQLKKNAVPNKLRVKESKSVHGERCPHEYGTPDGLKSEFVA